MATMNVLDSVGATVAIEKPLAPGTAADSASRPVAWSTEGKAQIGSLTETAPGSDTASSGLNGRLQRIAQRLTSLIALLPAALGAGGGLKTQIYNAAGNPVDPVAAGSAAMAASVPVTVATDDTQFAALLAALRGRVVQLVPSCDSTATAQYDVLAATEVITNAAAANDIPTYLRKVTVRILDRTTGVAMRLWFLSKNSSVGAENAAFAPADADIDDLIGYVDFAAADFIATTGMVNCFGQKDCDFLCLPAAGTKNIYFAIQTIESAGIDLGAATDVACEFHFI